MIDLLCHYLCDLLKMLYDSASRVILLNETAHIGLALTDTFSAQLSREGVCFTADVLLLYMSIHCFGWDILTSHLQSECVDDHNVKIDCRAPETLRHLLALTRGSIPV